MASAAGLFDGFDQLVNRKKQKNSNITKNNTNHLPLESPEGSKNPHDFLYHHGDVKTASESSALGRIRASPIRRKRS
jgi:hypothetical protein